MDKDAERKIGLVHSLAGLVLGIVSGRYLDGPNFNLLNVLLLGFVVSYPLMLLSKRLFNLSENEFGLKDWLAKGYFLFFVVWIVVWTFLYNLR